MKTFTINAGFVSMFQDKLSKFEKKFNKYGNGHLTCNIGEERYVSDKNDKFYKQIVVDVEVDAQYKVNGFEFIASLEYDTIAQQNIIKKASEDVKVPNIYRTRCECDHCKINRARLYTIILKNITTDEYVQVGKSCVKDYLGCDLGDYASYLSFFTNMEEYVEEQLNNIHCEGFRKAFEVQEVLEQTAKDVRLHGYTSKRQSWDYDTLATSTKIYYMMNGMGKIFKYEAIGDCDKEYAQKVLQFVNDADDTDNDYMHNLKIVANQKYVENDKLGMLVSAIGCYIHEQHKAEMQSKVDACTSIHVGSVGDKIELQNVAPCCVSTIDTMYGLLHIYTFTTGEGNVFVWRTNKGLNCDNAVNVKGTIKAHTQYNGIKQTELTRCKV